MQHFRIRGDSGPQAKVHSCIVSHIVDLRALYGDIAAADVLGASLRCLHLFESALGLTDSRGTESGSKVASQVKAAAILGLAIKMVVSADCTDEVPVARLWAKVAGETSAALVKALEIQLVNQWPGLDSIGALGCSRAKMRRWGVRMSRRGVHESLGCPHAYTLTC